MPNAPVSFTWFSFPLFAPLSGSVTQDIAPHLYRGVPEIEVDVIKEVGSFGAQIGALTKAVLELAERVDPGFAERRKALAASGASDEPRTPLEQLAVTAELVDAIKDRHRHVVERDARWALERLKALDEDAAGRLAARFRG